MPSFMLAVDLMWRWTPAHMDLIPPVNSKAYFIKYAVSFAHCGLKIMARWTPGSKDLIQAINSNKDFIGSSGFLCSLWIKNNGPLDSRILGFDSGHKFKQRFHQICRLFCSLWIQIDNGLQSGRTQGYDSGPHFKQGFHRTLRIINCSLWI